MNLPLLNAPTVEPQPVATRPGPTGRNDAGLALGVPADWMYPSHLFLLVKKRWAAFNIALRGRSVEDGVGEAYSQRTKFDCFLILVPYTG